MLIKKKEKFWPGFEGCMTGILILNALFLLCHIKTQGACQSNFGETSAMLDSRLQLFIQEASF